MTHYALPHIGGIEVYVDELAHGLVRRAHEVRLVTSGVSRPVSQPAYEVSAVAAWNVLERRLHVPYPLFAPSLLGVVQRAVRWADVVHAHGVLYQGSLAALASARRLTRPIVVTEHVGFVPYASGLLEAVEKAALAVAARLVLPRADVAIALNPRVLDWLAARRPAARRLEYVPNAVDTHLFRPAAPGEALAARCALGLPRDRKLVLCVGRFVPKKGLGLLAEALAGLEADLVLCGRGEVPALDPRLALHVLRDVPRSRMPEVYRAADLFALASEGEGFPNSVLEALASGLPVVAARDPAYDRYETGDGLVPVDRTPDALREAVGALLSNAEERARRGAAGRQAAVAGYDLDLLVDRHVQLYTDLTGGSGATERSAS